jgi:glycerophosphoryl diester phosphodiesterase
MDNIVILCHRGIFGNDIVENTLEAFMKVNTYINTGIELDIQITKDDEIICYHDFNLKRIHNIDKNVADLTIEDVNKLNITTLENVLKNINDVFIDIEIKSISFNKKICDKLIFLINLHKLKKYIITSFDINVIKYILSSSTLNCGLIISNSEIVEIEQLVENGIKNIIINKCNIDIYSKFKNELQIYAYTFFDKNSEDDDKNLKKCLDNNIYIITDDIEKTIMTLYNY